MTQNIPEYGYPYRTRDSAVSTLVGVILIIFLVFILSSIMYASIYGLVNSVEKTAYVATEVDIVYISQGTGTIVITHLNGDVMAYENQSGDAAYIVQFVTDDLEGSHEVIVDPALIPGDTTWSPGDQIFIFKRPDGYYLTDDPSGITGAVPFLPGKLGLRVIDLTHNQVIALLEPVTASYQDTPAPTTDTTTTPTTIPTTVPTTEPTQPPDCVNCHPGESFSVGFTTTTLGHRIVRFKDASSPQPNTRIWSFGDGGSASGELVEHIFPSAGTYQITLTVKRNNNPCTCTLKRTITVD
ncbi:MAG: PKD domain-containing protein [Methanospirillum sp.]|nr:PKD domain-containing protein [Methanospirillum sp.]